MRLTLICPFYNEEKYIPLLLDCIGQQDFSKDEWEVLFVDGQSQDGSRTLVENFVCGHSYSMVLDNPHRIVSWAVNIGVKAAQGEYIMRWDAHAWYPKDYCSTLVRLCKELDADNVGCACRTQVLHETGKSRAIMQVLSHPMGVGNSQFRLGVSALQKSDTVPLGCFPRRTFERFGEYDTRLVRNQDIEFNHRIVTSGGSIYLTPDTYFIYYARETWGALAQNNYNNGKWNILTVYHTRMFSSLSVRHFIPLLFVLSLIVPMLFALQWWPFILVSAASLLAYTALISAVSLKLTVTKHLNFFYLLTTFFVLHLSYGWGSLMGILILPFMKR